MATRTIRVGVVNPETWDFFHELYAFLSTNYETSVFKPRVSNSPVFRERIEKQLLNYDLKAFLRSNDVVFFEWSSQLLALATSLPKTCKIVTRLHRWELYAWADRINWDHIDHVILVSEAKRKEFCLKFPKQAGKTEVLSAGISLPRFRFSQRHFSGAIGILCHLSPRKRIYDLILTFSELVKKAPTLRLHIAGDPDPQHLDYYSSLLFAVNKLSLQDLVKFDGYIKETWEWYPQIDIFVSNSYSEGLQVAPMEAMACGCYTLSHHWEGAEELVPDENLYITGNDLLGKILAFCALTDLERDKERARMRCIAEEHFNVERSIQRVGRIIEQLARH